MEFPPYGDTNFMYYTTTIKTGEYIGDNFSQVSQN